MNGSLLVVDWDYFFPNPLEAGHMGNQAFWLYDWGHREAPFFIYGIWPTRAAGFGRFGLDVPAVNDEWRTFANRFRVAEGAMVYVADSNMWAGDLLDSNGDPFSDVWLYDAHHDSGYNVPTFTEWLGRRTGDAGVSYSCEDWMLIHHMQGSQLHWRAPRWHDSITESLAAGNVEWPVDVPLDAAIDDGSTPPEEFDSVFICRSGAWVPPWEDPKFSEFVMTWNLDVEQMDGHVLPRSEGGESDEGILVREWDPQLVAHELEIAAMVRKADGR